MFLGIVTGAKFNFQTEVRSADQNLARSYQCISTKGRMPEKKDEIALSILVLDALKIPRKLGEKVTLTTEVNARIKEQKTDTFTVCGYWEGDVTVHFRVNPAYLMFQEDGFSIKN